MVCVTASQTWRPIGCNNVQGYIFFSFSFHDFFFFFFSSSVLIFWGGPRMVQNFCCCWCLVLLVTVGRSALRFGTRSGRRTTTKPGSESTTTIRLQLSSSVLSCQSYTTTRRWRWLCAAAARATLSGVACMDQAVNHCHSDGSSCSPVFTTATTTLPPPQQPPACPIEVKHTLICESMVTNHGILLLTNRPHKNNNFMIVNYLAWQSLFFC